ELVKLSGTCSEGAPNWMPRLLNQATSILVSPANQLAYVSPQGDLYHCENGWRGTTFRSGLVDSTTRYRYASVSKLFTADAVLNLIAEGKLGLGTTLLELFPEQVPADP